MGLLPGSKGLQADGSIVDQNGLIISKEEADKIVHSVNALPVMQFRDQIHDLLSNGKDLIVDAATGSGKSTLIPIFARQATGRKVIQTVPRVLSAMSLGEWISKYLVSRTGNPEYTLGEKEIGYRTGAGKSSTHTSNLSIHTDGLEMMREMFSQIFPDVLILDEVQELSIATEVLLFIHKHKLDTQIIIMSATLEPTIYQKYMEISGRELEIVKVPGKVYPIEEHMENIGDPVSKTISLAKSGKHTLHFVAGKSRMDTITERLNKELGAGYEVMNLHAEMTKEEQFLAVHNPPEHITRVIVATNVAEASITIPYLNTVVDEGKHKVGYVNEQGIQELRVEPATQANVKQRRGRVGRVSEGEYFRFNSHSFEQLSEYPSAAIERTLLEREILLFQKAGMPLYQQISRHQDKGQEAFLHPVNKTLLNIGIERLEQIGALDSFGNITPLGEDLLSLSLNPSHGRMLIEGIKRGVTEEMIAISAIFSCNSFLSKDGKWRELQPGTNKRSDMFLYLDLYDLVTKTQINRDILRRMIYPLGLDADQVAEFDTPDNDKAFFEVVDLSPLGIKNHRVAQIFNKITQLQNSLIDRGIQVQKSKSISGKQIFIRAKEESVRETNEGKIRQDIIKDIITSISAGLQYFEFEYDATIKRLKHKKNHDTTVSTENFKKASISSVELQHGKSYIGVPFIIGSEELGDDLGLGEDDTEKYFDGGEGAGGDLCIVSHISELSDCNIKQAKITQSQYRESIFRDKKKNSDIPTSLESYSSIYHSLCEEFGSGAMTKENFLVNAVPLLLILKHPKFKKFVEGKAMSVVRGIQARLQKYFEHNKDHYLHRIGMRIDSIEKSFSMDSEIHDEFRDWEQRNITNKKRKRRKHIPDRELEQIEIQAKIHEESTQLLAEIGQLEGLMDSIDTQDISTKLIPLLDDFIVDIKATGETFNILYSVFQDEIGGLSQTAKKKAIAKLSAVENSSSQMRSLKTRVDQIQGAITHINRALNYAKSPTPKNFIAIDADKVIDYFGKPGNIEALTKSQRDKFYKGIRDLKNHFNDNTGAKRFTNGLNRAKTHFTGIIKDLEKKLTSAKESAEQKSSELLERKENIFKTRKELCIFFAKYYEAEYYETIINRKIPQILSELLESQDLEAVIEKWVIHTFNPEKMKSISRTKKIKDYIGLIGKFERAKNSIRKKIDTYNKSSPESVEEVISIREEVEKSRKKISDIKSKL